MKLRVKLLVAELEDDGGMIETIRTELDTLWSSLSDEEQELLKDLNVDNSPFEDAT